MFDIMTSLSVSKIMIGSQEHPNYRSRHTTYLRVLLGDIPRLDIFRAGEALGETEALGEAAGRGEGTLDGVLVGVLGDGVRLEELVLATVSRLVGLFRPGEAGRFLTAFWASPGDLERLRGEPGTDRVGRGETGRENVVLGEPGMERGALQPDPGTARERPPQQSSSSSSRSAEDKQSVRLSSGVRGFNS